MKPAARIGDNCFPHVGQCAMPFTLIGGSPNVLINARPACMLASMTLTHTFPAGPYCIPHTSTVISCKSKVLINGRPAATIGDVLGPACTHVINGSKNVLL